MVYEAKIYIILIAIAVLLIVIKGLRSITRFNSRRLKVWQGFAESKSNGRFYEPSMLLNSTVPVYKGVHSQTSSPFKKADTFGTIVFNPKINSSANPEPACIYFDQYVPVLSDIKGSQKNLQQTIISIPIKQTNERSYAISALENAIDYTRPINFPGHLKYEPEGDCAQYFDIYLQENRQGTALTILNPAVMQFMLENIANCDVEIFGDTLYVYVCRFIDKPSELEELTDKSSKLAEIINNNIPSNNSHLSDGSIKKIQSLDPNLYFVVLTFINISLVLVIKSFVDDMIAPTVIFIYGIALTFIFAKSTQKTFTIKRHQKKYGKNSFV